MSGKSSRKGPPILEGDFGDQIMVLEGIEDSLRLHDDSSYNIRGDNLRLITNFPALGINERPLSGKKGLENEYDDVFAAFRPSVIAVSRYERYLRRKVADADANIPPAFSIIGGSTFAIDPGKIVPAQIKEAQERENAAIQKLETDVAVATRAASVPNSKASAIIAKRLNDKAVKLKALGLERRKLLAKARRDYRRNRKLGERLHRILVSKVRKLDITQMPAERAKLEKEVGDLKRRTLGVVERTEALAKLIKYAEALAVNAENQAMLSAMASRAIKAGSTTYVRILMLSAYKIGRNSGKLKESRRHQKRFADRAK